METNSHAKIIGDRGEKIAAEFLAKKKYEIVTLQYRYKNGELDIVARTNGILVFVEVKTVDLTKYPTSPYGEPETWLTVKKQKFMRQCANHYLWKKNITGVDCRFDFITVRLYPDREEVNHIENAFWM